MKTEKLGIRLSKSLKLELEKLTKEKSKKLGIPISLSTIVVWILQKEVNLRQNKDTEKVSPL